MKAAIVEQPGQPPSYRDFPDPRPEPGEVRITVSASALSPLARGRAAGTHYSSNSQFPFVVGVDGVGRLDDGQRVYFMLPRAPFGGMAEQTIVSNGHWLPLPDDIEDTTAAVIANPGMSSWAALVERARIRVGETVLVNGATGAAGQLAIKIARHLGAAKVIATGRDQDVLASLGADATITLDQEQSSLDEAFRQQLEAGVDIVLDYLWGDSARSLLVAATKARRDRVPLRFVQIGTASAAEMALPGAVLRSAAVELTGSGLGSVGLDRLAAAIDGVLRMAGSARLTLAHRCVPLAEIAGSWLREDGRTRTVYTMEATVNDEATGR